MQARVISLNVGTPKRQRPRGPLSGIDKRPVGEIEVRDPGPRATGDGSGVVGDSVMDRRNHGGSSKAVYAFAREELDWWQPRIERTLPDGAFGENLTTRDVWLEQAVIGARWAVGDEVVLEVAGPRIPCRTFEDKMGIPGWLRSFVAHARAGAYFRVATPGRIRTGATITELSRPDHGITVDDVWLAKLGDIDRARTVLDLGILDELNADRLQRSLDRWLARPDRAPDGHLDEATMAGGRRPPSSDGVDRLTTSSE